MSATSVSAVHIGTDYEMCVTAGLTRGVSSEVDGQEERERGLKTKIEAEKARCVS